MEYPQELLLSGFKVENAFPAYRTPYPALTISFTIRNGSKNKGYSISASLCRIYAFGRLVGSFSLYTHGNGWTRVAGHVKPRVGEIEGGIGKTFVLPDKTLKFEEIFWLTPDLLRFVNEEFEKGVPGKRKVDLKIEIFLHATRFKKMDAPREAPVYEGGTVHRFDFQHTIGEIEWVAFLKSWGYRTTLIYVPVNVAEKLQEAMKTMGFLKEWEVIDELMKKIKDIKPQQLLLCTKETLKQKYLELVNTTSKQLLIMCRAIDELVGEHIVKAKAEKNIDVKLIIAPASLLKHEKFPELRRFQQTIRSLRDIGVEIKENTNIHARILIADDKVIVGSTDPDYFGLMLHINASVYTEDPTVIEKAKMFFDDVWRDSRQVATS